MCSLLSCCMVAMMSVVVNGILDSGIVIHRCVKNSSGLPLKLASHCRLRNLGCQVNRLFYSEIPSFGPGNNPAFFIYTGADKLSCHLYQFTGSRPGYQTNC